MTSDQQARAPMTFGEIGDLSFELNRLLVAHNATKAVAQIALATALVLALRQSPADKQEHYRLLIEELKDFTRDGLIGGVAQGAIQRPSKDELKIIEQGGDQ